MNYFDENEIADIQYFSDFWEKVLKSQMPISGATARGTFFDGYMVNSTGGTYALEFKHREKDYDCIFLEPSKLYKMEELWRLDHAYPLYINFILDKVYIWEILQCSPTLRKNVPIYDKGRREWKYEDRWCLDKNQATIWEKTDTSYKRIHTAAKINSKSAMPEENNWIEKYSADE